MINLIVTIILIDKYDGCNHKGLIYDQINKT